MDGYPLTLSVPRADAARGLLGLRHTAYLVQIDDCGRIYECHRRYTNFLWLHRELKQREVTAALPELPPKRAVGSLEAAFIEQRRRLLEAYLRALLRLPQVVLDDTLWAFLDADVATTAVPRFLCRPTTPAGSFDCLTQLTTVAGQEASAFRLCSQAVLKELVRFAQAEAAESAVQTGPAPTQPSLQARLGSRLRLCSITQALARQERARQGLVEAGMFGALLALLWRTTLDSQAAASGSAAAAADVDSHEAASSGVKHCLNLLLEGSQGMALLDFCQQDSGLRELQRLAAAQTSSLHITVANLLWYGFQSSCVVAALAGAKMGLPLVGKLLTSPELAARAMASLCVCCLVRQEGVLDGDAEQHCLEALAPLPQQLEEAEAAAVARAAASVSAAAVDCSSSQAQEAANAANLAQGAGPALAAERDAALSQLLTRLSSPGEVQRLQALIGGCDAVTSCVVSLLDHLVRQSPEEPERLRCLSQLSGPLQALLEGCSGSEAAGSELCSQAARVLLRLDWAGGAAPAKTGASVGREAVPPFHAFGQRLRVLEHLTGQAEVTQASAAQQLARAQEHCRRQQQEVLAAHLADEPCMASSRLDSFCAHLSGLADRRSSLVSELQRAQKAVEALGAGLDQRNLRRGVLEADVALLCQALDEQAAMEAQATAAGAAVSMEEERSREAAEAAEVQLAHLRAAESTVSEATQRSQEAESHAATLAKEEAEKAEMCHSAPAQLERLQARLADVERQRGGSLQEASEVSGEQDSEERQLATLAEAEQEASAALDGIEEVRRHLEALQKTLASELILTEEEANRLRELERTLPASRPLRLRHGLGRFEPAPGAEEPPDWDEGEESAEAEFRTNGHFRAFSRLCEERQQLWLQEQAWLVSMAKGRRSKVEALETRRAALEAAARSAEAEAEGLRRALSFWGHSEELRREHEVASVAAARARADSRQEQERALEAQGARQLAEARRDQARVRAAEADGQLLRARSAADAEAESCIRARLDLHQRCTDLEARAKAYLEGWLTVELEERQIALLEGQVAMHLRDEAQSRQALRSEIARLIADLTDLDSQLNVDASAEPQ